MWRSERQAIRGGRINPRSRPGLGLLLILVLANGCFFGCAGKPAEPPAGGAGASPARPAAVASRSGRDSLVVKVLTNTLDLIGPNDFGPDGKPDVCLEVPVPAAEIRAVRVDGENEDGWQTPYNGRNWDLKVVPGEAPSSSRIYFAPSQTRRNYRVTLLRASGVTESGIAFLVPGQRQPEGLPPAPASLELPRRLPPDIEAAWRRLPRDGNGQVIGVRVGRYWLHGSAHVQVARGLVMGRADGQGTVAPIRVAQMGDYTLREYPEPIGTDDILEELPPIGTAVWQVVRPGLYRTSRIDRYVGSLTPPDAVVPGYAFLRADGPYPGVPIGGDSGSVCFARVNGKVRVLGVCGVASSVFIAVPLRWPASFQVAPGERPMLRLPPGGTLSFPFPPGSPTTLPAETTWNAPPP